MKADYPEFPFILLLIGAIFLLSNCENARAPVEIVPNPGVPLTVLQPDGQPADPVQIRVFDKNRGREINLCDTVSLCEDGKPGCCGSYFIFHNELTDVIENRPTFQTRKITLEVEGTLDSLFFREEFVVASFGGDVFKIAGPDTVYLEPNIE